MPQHPRNRKLDPSIACSDARNANVQLDIRDRQEVLPRAQMLVPVTRVGEQVQNKVSFEAMRYAVSPGWYSII